jgi:hypothetical protein
MDIVVQKIQRSQVGLEFGRRVVPPGKAADPHDVKQYTIFFGAGNCSGQVPGTCRMLFA